MQRSNHGPSKTDVSINAHGQNGAVVRSDIDNLSSIYRLRAQISKKTSKTKVLLGVHIEICLVNNVDGPTKPKRRASNIWNCILCRKNDKKIKTNGLSLYFSYISSLKKDLTTNIS